MPGGALPVPHGDEVVAIARRLAPDFAIVVAVQDWHPPTHRSFAVNNPGTKVGDVIELAGMPQVMWPPHCVQGTHGAELHVEIPTPTVVFRKGTDPDIDSYSAFFDNGHRKSTGLRDWLRTKHVDTLHIMGLATDYCVKYSVIDARVLGFAVIVHAEGCRGIDLAPGDSQRAFDQMRAAGALVIDSQAAADREATAGG
jgi:nicotinamidase/pyrazinamidase